MIVEAGSPHQPFTPHEAARLYATHGYRVVPIAPGQKYPRLDAWQTAATSDLTLIDAWWTGLYRDHGVGLLMGHDRLFALDIDITDGKHGDETLRDLEDTYHELPETVEQITGSGGRHLIYRAPPNIEIRNDAGKRLGPGLDIRGIGGQIVAAPTIHPNGTPYVWVWDSAPWERQPADAPDWLIGLLTREDEAWNTDSPRSTPQSSAAASPSSVSAAGSAHGSTGTSAPSKLSPSTPERPGDRFNQATTWAALLEADGWTRNRDGHEGEQRWTRPGKSAREGISATVGYKGSDVLKVFTSSVPTLEIDRTYDRFGYWAATRHHGSVSDAARALGTAERDVTGIIGTWGRDDPPTGGPSGPATEPTSSTTTGEDPQASQPGLFRWRVDWPTFWQRERADANWHLEPILARGRGHSIWAGAKTGKSYHVLPMAAAIATGHNHLNMPTRPPEPVIYMDYEMTEDDLYDRLEEFGYGPNDDLEHLHYISLPSIPGLDTRDGALYILEAVRASGATTVFIDTISRAVEGPDNDADTIRAFYRHTGIALKEAGITWARLDHGGKDLTKGTRGTSAKNDDVDIVWKLTRRDGGMCFEATHRRMSWVPEKVDIYVTETNGITHFALASVGMWPAKTRETADELDRLEVPIDASERDARPKLKAAEFTASNDVLRAALKFRRQRVTELVIRSHAEALNRAENDPARPFSDPRHNAPGANGADQETAGHRVGAADGAPGANIKDTAPSAPLPSSGAEAAQRADLTPWSPFD